MLESGQLAGKIVCPNKKCGAKIGNYDWAGVCCGCREWVTPASVIPLGGCVVLMTIDGTGFLHSSFQGRRDCRVIPCGFDSPVLVTLCDTMHGFLVVRNWVDERMVFISVNLHERKG